MQGQLVWLGGSKQASRAGRANANTAAGGAKLTPQQLVHGKLDILATPHLLCGWDFKQQLIMARALAGTWAGSHTLPCPALPDGCETERQSSLQVLPSPPPQCGAASIGCGTSYMQQSM